MNQDQLGDGYQLKDGFGRFYFGSFYIDIYKATFHEVWLYSIACCGIGNASTTIIGGSSVKAYDTADAALKAAKKELRDHMEYTLDRLEASNYD